MQIKNTYTHYGVLAKMLHWLMAGLFLGMFIIAYIMINIRKSDFRLSLYDLHKATGILLLILVAGRVAWRFLNIQPLLANSIPFWQKNIARWNIFLLYCLMFTMPITGLLTSTLSGHQISFYGFFILPPLGNSQVISTFFSQTHEILSYVVIIAFIFHLMGSFYHHFFIKDDVLKRMWIK